MLTRPLHWLFLLLYGRLWIPRNVQIAARQWIAKRILARSRNTWPIDESTGSQPPGWNGWPDKKKFGLLLTHDVDTEHGLKRCRLLMDMEEQLGFRSAFYFVPRGRYEAPPELLAEMVERGFEVGVHGLYHDWWTFLSRRVFERRAPHIRHYMRQWGAVGFRAPSMVKNLDWIRELGVEYDASTFDTDPFEPTPQGAGTIFPFWVDGVNGRPGYVEIPYTFPQDLTLFVLLQEKDTAIWQKKLRWLVQKGGLAVIDTHPDYMHVGDGGMRCDEYPVSHYRTFLEHIRTHYSDAYWHVLPKKMARHFLTCSPTPARPSEAVPPTQSPARANGQKIWVDLDNTPHVPLFRPIIRELECRGYSVLVTARDAFQVVDLAQRMGVSCQVVGRHYGKRKFFKGLGLCVRALQLAPIVLKNKPVLAVSHGSRSQLILATMAGIPRVQIADYEHSGSVPLAHPDWLIVPECITDRDIHWPHQQTLRYPGIKEDVYVPDFEPDARIYEELKLSPADILATIRPPATEAHYHNPESEPLFFESLEWICQHPGAKIVLLPRNEKQEQWVRKQASRHFANGRIRVPSHALDGLNLLWHSDLVISGGGTMNREAAALGVPVYSIFRGKMGSVDRHLVNEGRLVMIECIPDVRAKIHIGKRAPSSGPFHRDQHTLKMLVNQIEACLKAPRKDV